MTTILAANLWIFVANVYEINRKQVFTCSDRKILKDIVENKKVARCFVNKLAFSVCPYLSMQNCTYLNTES